MGTGAYVLNHECAFNSILACGITMNSYIKAENAHTHL